VNGNTRTETDTIGAIEVPADRYWGAQTERSRRNFNIGWEKQPIAIIRALGLIKRTAAEVNRDLGKLEPRLAAAIIAAAGEVHEGKLDEHFPLRVWQTGSGTQTNMNANEVIANRAIEILGGTLGAKSPVHPNDHVNLSQSSNDTYPTALHIAAVTEIGERLLPALMHLRDTLREKEKAWEHIVKIGRTHTQDAMPLTLGQEVSGYAQQITNGIARVEASLPSLLELAQGGTAVGTGFAAPPSFAHSFAERIAAATGIAFTTAPNKFEAIAAKDAIVAAHGAINAVAVSLFKIGNDVRLLSSGPRAGLMEFMLPANEPGSSIMPGKVNPTQCEAVTQACVHVFGNNAAIGFAGSQGQFELNAFAPLLGYNLLQSITLLADATVSFADKSLAGLAPAERIIAKHVDSSLMLVTALVPKIGYDAAAEIAKAAYANDTTLREQAIASGKITADEFDELVVPAKMTKPLA
jgi:fumarate hydratase class II